jgi:putative 4-hydroxybenzoate polyprenyltransferase
MRFDGSIHRPCRTLKIQIKTYASFVRFSHSVFALPFALTGALLALHRLNDWTLRTVAGRFVWIVVAMVTARSAAMGFNRLADASHDALNPRTALRELPRGVMTAAEARAFIIVSSVLFVVAAWKLGPICLILSPLALAIVFWYSLAKRFTNYTQLFLGLAMAVAPVGGWLAAGSNPGCWQRQSAHGSAASMSCMPVRIWNSIARTGYIRYPSTLALRGRSSSRA